MAEILTQYGANIIIDIKDKVKEHNKIMAVAISLFPAFTSYSNTSCYSRQ